MENENSGTNTILLVLILVLGVGAAVWFFRGVPADTSPDAANIEVNIPTPGGQNGTGGQTGTN